MDRIEMESIFLNALLIDCLAGFDSDAFIEAVDDIVVERDIEKKGLGSSIDEFLKLYKIIILENDPEYLEHMKRHFSEKQRQVLKEEL